MSATRVAPVSTYFLDYCGQAVMFIVTRVGLTFTGRFATHPDEILPQELRSTYETVTWDDSDEATSAAITVLETIAETVIQTKGVCCWCRH